MDNLWITLFGLIPSALFSARMFVQWFLSEKSKKIVSPVIYWQLSLIASFLMFIYGWLRADFAITLSQLFSYYIYIWNLNILNQWKKINRIVRILLLLTPAVVISMLVITGSDGISRLWKDIAFGLLLFGTTGQIIFAFRFVYQWWYSRKFHQSILPNGFWVISIVGSVCNLIYGIIRKDPILILNHAPGLLTYSRNLYLSKKNKQKRTD
jgi:lipid-A-disaccharide synthase-like uncharacterized protein